MARSGRVDQVVAHADFDGLLSAVKFLRKGVPPWPEADEDARAADSPGRGHSLSGRARIYVAALDEAAATLRSKQREAFRQPGSPPSPTRTRRPSRLRKIWRAVRAKRSRACSSSGSRKTWEGR
ncbi:MAG: hypothetical protein E6J85_17420 [Deltaproteobacteria bacterium]|nr:MAG: hypothetical protein E6J85_17420 [Deltaproteobacteria bacterium]